MTNHTAYGKSDYHKQDCQYDNNDGIVIRTATKEDAPRLLEIYSYYVEHTAISFETVVPSLKEFEQRIADVLSSYPYLVVERDGELLGYAYAHPFVGRPAYDWSAELTIYLEPFARKCGLGRRLIEALERDLAQMGILNIYSCIGIPTEEEDEYLNFNSMQFHEHMGFKLVGTFKDCGYKFNRFYTMIWMEKVIGEHVNGRAPKRTGPTLHTYRSIA